MTRLVAMLALAAIAGCAGPPEKPAGGGESASRPSSIPISQLLKRPPDYYTDDGPDGTPPVDLARVADAVPRLDPLHPSANEPYTVFGRSYEPMKALAPYRRQGTASWYGRKYHGQRTTAGEIFDMYAMTASHATLPVPSYARITNLASRASVVVRINDRGPFASGRITDVSYAAAYRLGFAQTGSAQVEVEAVLPPGHETVALAAPGVAAPAENPVPKPAANPGSKPAPSPAPAPVMPVTQEQRGIYLQLGAFSLRDNAENFRARMARQLESLGVEVSTVQQGKLHRVQLGPYRDRGAAGAAAERVRALIEVKPIVVSR